MKHFLLKYAKFLMILISFANLINVKSFACWSLDEDDQNLQKSFQCSYSSLEYASQFPGGNYIPLCSVQNIATNLPQINKNDLHVKKID